MRRNLSSLRAAAIFGVLLLLVLALGGILWVLRKYTPVGLTERITTDQSRTSSLIDHHISISGDGRLIVYSEMGQIREGGPWSQGVWLHDRGSGKIERISKGSDGSPENSTSFNPAISANGRYIAYVSSSSNIVPTDANGAIDIFVYDIQSEKTSLVSVSTHGEQAVFDSSDPSISADGRSIVFLSDASNLVPGDNNGVRDVFLRDCSCGETTRIVAGTDNDQTNGVPYLPVISADGRFVLFYHEDPSHLSKTGQYITRVILYDRQNEEIERIAEVGQRPYQYSIPGKLSISADEQSIVLPVWSEKKEGDLTWYQPEWMLFDRETGAATPVLEEAVIVDPSISADGRYILFVTGDTTLVEGDGNGQPDVFVFDRKTGKYTLVSISSYGDQGNRPASSPIISADGLHVVFISESRTLVANDTNGAEDIFVHDLGNLRLSLLRLLGRGGQDPKNVSYPPPKPSVETTSPIYPYPYPEVENTASVSPYPEPAPTNPPAGLPPSHEPPPAAPGGGYP